MAVYDIEEQEQIEDLKAWWAQYGKYVSAAITTLAVVVIGVQGWRWYQQTQARDASVLYQAVSQAAHANDAAKAKEPATQLLDRFARTGSGERSSRRRKQLPRRRPRPRRRANEPARLRRGAPLRHGRRGGFTCGLARRLLDALGLVAVMADRTAIVAVVVVVRQEPSQA